MLFVELQNIGRSHLFRGQKQRHIAYDLARRRHFYNIAEQLIDFRVHSLHFAPAMA